MVNRIVAVGRLTRDPENKTTNNGVSVTTFTIASSRDFVQANGERETDFIPVVTWRGLAETCGKYCYKGQLVAVDGRLQIRNYEANDGSRRSIAEIVADNVQFLTPKKESTVVGEKVVGEETAPLDDDIPF